MELEKENNDNYNALMEVVKAYESALLRYVTHLLGNANASDDIVQNTFIKFIHSWKKKIEVSNEVSAWLYRVAHNEAIDYMRQENRIRKLHQTYSDEYLMDTKVNSTPAQFPEVEEALSKLTSREREIIVLKIYEEKSYKEIAEITGLTTSNIGFILHMTMKKLRNFLIKNGGTNGGK